MAGGMEAIASDLRRSLGVDGLARLAPLKGGLLFIAGGTGFVGTWLSALVAHLNDEHGFRTRVTSLSRRPSRLAAQAPFLANRDDLQLVEGDVRGFTQVPAGVEWVINAAGSPDSRAHATSPIETASTIADGTAHLLRAVEGSGRLRNFLHLSSGLIGSEGVRPVGASSIYADAKRYSEALCAAYRTQARLPVVIARPFTFMGPFQPLDAPWAANNFLHAALNGRPLKLLGSGKVARAYLYGSDMAVLALTQLVGGRSGETYDLGGVEPVLLIDLAEMVLASAGRPLEIRLNTAGRDGPSDDRLVPDMTRSMQAFGFKPAFGPQDTVARTLQWHRASPTASA